MTNTNFTLGGALRRVGECVLMAFGVPVQRDVPADAVFLPMGADADLHYVAEMRRMNAYKAAGLWSDETDVAPKPKRATATITPADVGGEPGMFDPGGLFGDEHRRPVDDSLERLGGYDEHAPPFVGFDPYASDWRPVDLGKSGDNSFFVDCTSLDLTHQAHEPLGTNGDSWP
ncbi:MAG: hypothetical protein QM750_20045 [Rubrivivax sp.]